MTSIPITLLWKCPPPPRPPGSTYAIATSELQRDHCSYSSKYYLLVWYAFEGNSSKIN